MQCRWCLTVEHLDNVLYMISHAVSLLPNCKLIDSGVNSLPSLDTLSVNRVARLDLMLSLSADLYHTPGTSAGTSAFICSLVSGSFSNSQLVYLLSIHKVLTV